MFFFFKDTKTKTPPLPPSLDGLPPQKPPPFWSAKSSFFALFIPCYYKLSRRPDVIHEHKTHTYYGQTFFLFPTPRSWSQPFFSTVPQGKDSPSFPSAFSSSYCTFAHFRPPTVSPHCANTCFAPSFTIFHVLLSGRFFSSR